MTLFCKFSLYLSRKALANSYRTFSTNHPLQTENVNSELDLKLLSNDEKGIAVIGLNRPKAMNSFSRSLVDSFSATVDHLHHDKDVRVVILRSLVPGVFCAGADLKAVPQCLIRSNQNQDGCKCRFCFKLLNPGQKCGKCKRAVYCGKECQFQDWKYIKHNLICSETFNHFYN